MIKPTSCFIIFNQKLVVMTRKEKISQKLLERIKNLTVEKLQSLDEFISSLENEKNSKSEILSFAGIFSDLDLPDELTTGLHENRKKGNSRIL